MTPIMWLILVACSGVVFLVTQCASAITGKKLPVYDLLTCISCFVGIVSIFGVYISVAIMQGGS